MSHELRTPVTVLRSSLEALCDGVIQEPKEVAEYHDSMLSETIHLQRMIGDLLELSRLQNPDYVMKFATLDLTQTIDDALRSANHIAAKKNISLDREVSGSDCVVYGDYGRIRLQNHRGIPETPSGKQYNVKTIKESNTRKADQTLRFGLLFLYWSYLT